ncbi:MAG: ATP-binding protein [Trebonia sp.]
MNITAAGAGLCPLTGSHRSLRLAAVDTAPGLARTVIRDWLPVVGLAGLEDAVVQVASELVANAYQASERWAARRRWSCLPPLHFVLDACGDRVLIEVWDVSEQPPVADAQPGLESERGRGLFIVEAMAERWGWRLRTDMPGKCVWAIVR